MRTMVLPQLQFIDKVINVPVCGKGWRGRLESDSQVACHQNSLHVPRWCIGRDISSAQRPHHLHHHQVQTGCVASCVARVFVPAVDMMNVERDAGGGTGSARRRREGRLRSMSRHERMSVAMDLAESTHHSAQRLKTAIAREGGTCCTSRPRSGGASPPGFPPTLSG